MHCANCGTDTPYPAAACQVCSTPFPRSVPASESETMAHGTGPIVPGDPRASDPDATVAGYPQVPFDEAPTRLGTAEVGSGRGSGSGTGGVSRRQIAGPLEPGEPFGTRYRILRVLGAGGMGVVYQAWDEELGVAVALKVIRPEVMADPETARDIERRFKRELLLARQVTHRNVVRIHDLGEVNGVKYITMPFIEGTSLASVLTVKRKLPVAEMLPVARDIAAGLCSAHEAGVVHRDLKPENVMLASDGSAIIMDFGISRSASAGPEQPGKSDPSGKTRNPRFDPAMAGLTMAGAVVGTLDYMAPEQAKAEAIDQRADIYSFGLIVRDMLLGLRKTSGNTAIDDLMARIKAAPPAVRTVDPQVPEPVDALVSRCLQPDPAARYQTSQELLAELNRLDDEGQLKPEPRRLTWKNGSAAALVLLALLTGTWWLAKTPPLPAAHEPVPVLVADFDNRSGDPAFEGAVEQTLTIALEAASYITVFKTRDARAIAAQLAPGRGNRITQEVGQLIARREGIKVLVNGAIESQPGGYRIELRAIDPVTGNPIATSTRSVTDKAAVLQTVASMATTVRAALGESKSEMTKVAAAETVSASSLEAMSAYARGQELNYAGRQMDALKAFQEAVTLDPGLARAYSGMGVIYGALKQDAKVEESYTNALKHLDRMSEREKYRTLGGYYLLVTHNYEKAIENYEMLVRQYPADDTGHANLAYAYLNVRNVPRAVEEGRKAIEIYPKNTLQRTNYAMYSMYAGDFATAVAESNTVLEANPSFEYALLTVANAQVGAGDLTAAGQAWARLAAVSPLGASMANLGRADLAMFLGRNRDAVAILTDGIKADEAAASAGEAAAKYVALAEAHQAMGNRAAAIRAARQASSLRVHESVVFPAALVLTESGDAADAEFGTQLAANLENMLQSQTTSYARLILGTVAFKQKRLGDALAAFRDGQKLHDSWFAHLMLGRVYLEAGRFAEAVAEFDLCVKRKGEATDVFFENISTSRYLPPVYYWLGRAQESLGAASAAKASYEQFVKLRAQSDPADPLAIDAARRLKL
jgi:serine/threonine protein kinase/Flp pilus assembly protein TadD